MERDQRSDRERDTELERGLKSDKVKSDKDTEELELVLKK